MSLEMINIFSDSTIVLAPKYCYVIDKDCPTGHKYEVFYEGKKLNNVEGIIFNSLIK